MASLMKHLIVQVICSGIFPRQPSPHYTPAAQLSEIKEKPRGAAVTFLMTDHEIYRGEEGLVPVSVTIWRDV